MTRVNVYGVFDGDELVYQGTREEVAMRFNLKKTSIYGYTHHGTKIGGAFLVKVIGSKDQKIEYYIRNSTYKRNYVPEKVPDYHEDPLGCLIRHLKLYGNTSVKSFDPRKYEKDLAKIGIRCKITEIPDTIGELTKRRRSKKVHYLVEVI